MTTTTITVTGMTCGHCTNAVAEELGHVPGVRDVAVVLETGAVTITSDAPIATEALRAAVEEAGYEVAP